MRLYERLKDVGLFAVGCTLGGLAVITLQSGGSVSATDRIAMELESRYEGGREAVACTPTSDNDDVFFISCGGIY